MEEAPPAADVLGLVTRTSGWGQVRLYAASVSTGYVRRSVDSITPIFYALALAVLVPTARTTDGVEASVAEFVAALPTVVAPIAAVPYDFLAVWVVGMVVVAAFRKHWRLVALAARRHPRRRRCDLRPQRPPRPRGRRPRAWRSALHSRASPSSSW